MSVTAKMGVALESGNANAADARAAERHGVVAARPSRVTLYVAAVFCCAFLFAIALVYVQYVWDALPGLSIFSPRFSAPAFLFFLTVGVLADRYRVNTGEGAEMSAGFLADFLSAALLGPLVGAAVAAGSFLVGNRRTELMRTVFDVSAFILVGGSTGLIYWLFQASLEGNSASLLVGGLAAGAAYFLINLLIYYPLVRMRRGLELGEWFNEGFRPFLPFHMFFLTVSLGLLYSFDRLGPPGFALFFLPVTGLVYAFRAFSRQRELTRSLERFSLQMAASMITALDFKDNYTAQHSAAVAQYAFDTACALKMSQKERSVAHLAGLLHDLGKISVPDEILNSRARLGAEDWAVIQGHAGAGQSVVSNMHEFEELGKIIRHHHERYDGSGYPDGVTADGIPLISRIVAVADSYSAMVSERPYSAKLRPEEAMAELQSKSGTQFDPQVVNAFLCVLQAATAEYRRAEQLDFHLQFQKARFLGEIS
ncbi:MAG: HD-GYP domain-containing protein [Thermoleophilia bacterium]